VVVCHTLIGTGMISVNTDCDFMSGYPVFLRGTYECGCV
jgi:hypothetical protein